MSGLRELWEKASADVPHEVRAEAWEWGRLLVVLALAGALLIAAPPARAQSGSPAGNTSAAGNPGSSGNGVTTGSTSPSGYRIGPKDRLQISVRELPDFRVDEVVAEDGTLDLPETGRVEVQGYTEGELALRLKNLLEGRGVRTATVTVRILDFRAQPLTMLGAVAGQATLPARGRALLLDLLRSAGGLTDDHGDQLIVRRQATNGLADELEIPLAELMSGREPRWNVPIFSGDVIHVPPAAKVTVYFLGEMSGSLEFSSTERVTLLAALAKNGGLAETASNKITIRRQVPGGEVQNVVVNYRRILEGRDQDPSLRDGDIIVVKESFF